MAKLRQPVWAIRDKTTGHLLVVNPDVQEYGDYGGWEDTYNTYSKAVVVLHSSTYPGVVFSTTDENLVDFLLLPPYLRCQSYDPAPDTYQLRWTLDRLGDLEKVRLHLH